MIDKLYLIRKEFVKRRKTIESYYTNEEKNSIFAKIYEDRPDIKIELSKIREEKEGLRSGERYEQPLNHYWDEMISRNPSMEDEESYNKNILFQQAAEKLGLWKEIEYEEELIDYDFNKGVTQNPRVARNNLILKLMRHRLMDPETLRDRLTPGGFDNARSAANYLKELLGINEEQDAADPSTLLFYNQLNQVAAKLIGIFANQNTNHQLSSVVKQLDLVEPIIFDGMMDAKLLRSTEPLEGKTESELKGKVGSTLLGKEIQLSDGTVVDIDLNLAEFLAASVDAVKDPVLNYLNFNTTTASVGALLARMGYATKDIGILFNQPIIREICEVIQNSGGITTFATAKSNVLKNYTEDSNELKNANTRITSGHLASQIRKYRSAEQETDRKKALNNLRSESEFKSSQLSALKIFEQAYNASRELNKFIATTKFTASNAVGSTMGFFYNQQYTVENYINQEENALKMVIYESLKGAEAGQKSLDINTPRELMNDREGYIKTQVENPFAFEQCMYDLNKELLNILEKYYPYNKSIYSDRRNMVNSFLSNGNVLDAETIDNIHRETSQHVLTSTDSAFNPNATCEVNENYTNRYYYLYKFPIELFNMMKQGKIPPIIAKYLGFSYSEYTDRNTNAKTKQLHISVNLSVEQSDKNTFTDAWAQLALGDEASQNIAKGLFFHNYYKLGFSVGPFSFMQFTPLEVKNLLTVGRGYDRMSYLDFIGIDNIDKLSVASTTGRTPRSIVEFGYMFALNHPDNYKLVKRMPSEGNSKYASYFVDSTTRQVKDIINIDLSSVEKDTKDANAPFIASLDSKTGNFKVHPVIMRGKAAYVAMIDGEYNFRGNLGQDSRVTYVKVPILGAKSMFNTYASTLNEAIAIRNESAEKLKTIEDELSKEDQQAIIENSETQSETVDTDELLNGTPEEDLFKNNSAEAEETGEGFNEEIQYTEEDVDALAERLSKCNQISEEFLIDYILKTLEETNPNTEFDREEMIPAAKANVAQKAEEILAGMHIKSAAISEATRKQLLINDLVSQLKDGIKSGRTKVYTSLTKEEIC